MHPRSEDHVLCVGAGLLALHVADDTLIQPPAGTTWMDHLVSGLIPIGLLVIAATVYPRLRSTARGLLASTSERSSLFLTMRSRLSAKGAGLAPHLREKQGPACWAPRSELSDHCDGASRTRTDDLLGAMRGRRPSFKI